MKRIAAVFGAVIAVVAAMLVASPTALAVQTGSCLGHSYRALDPTGPYPTVLTKNFPDGSKNCGVITPNRNIDDSNPNTDFYEIPGNGSADGIKNIRQDVRQPSGDVIGKTYVVYVNATGNTFCNSYSNSSHGWSGWSGC